MCTTYNVDTNYYMYYYYVLFHTPVQNWFSRRTGTIDTTNNAAYKAVKKGTEQDESIEGDYANVSRTSARYTGTPSPVLSRCAYKVLY